MTDGWLGRPSLLVAVSVLIASCQHASAGSPVAGTASTPAPAAVAASSADEVEGLIFERQQLMMQLDTDTKTLGMIASGAAPASKLAETTRAIAQSAKESAEAFRAKVPGGRSKPEVWSNNEDFMRRMEAFAVDTERMAKLGETGNVMAVSEMMVDALPCKQCHDVYRAPKR